MYTKEMILKLAEEMETERAKTKEMPHYYKRNGKILERSYPDYIETERYKFLFYSDESPLSTEKIFKSSVSGKMLAYLDLERWCCDFEEDYYISSWEYEDEMGEDL